MSTDPSVKRSVSLAIHDPDGRILQVRRPLDDPDLPGVWGLPAASLRGDEDWVDAVRRAGRDKLGLSVAPVRVLREGTRDRSAYRLEMRLYEARLTSGRSVTPELAGPDPSVTRYADWRWGDAAGLEPAAAGGSLCSALYLETMREGGLMVVPLITLEITESDADVLADTLESYLSDLRMEISDTDSQDFRDGLKERKAALLRVLDAVRNRAGR